MNDTEKNRILNAAKKAKQKSGVTKDEAVEIDNLIKKFLSAMEGMEELSSAIAKMKEKKLNETNGG